eukprot:CAMPEP_0194267118 /NCGR_PEP_ID=MMETSP0169-20130528/1762_1 /TAXON_ID=218684 /ORGANISM="Corethron pennatum, Strain L29A3" /LENGTH=1026 /DNA_ID=CAMNT_0039007927 /DNA_START=62 /DNA_END=3139 /DNA_ORIENTATION=-
MRLPSRAPPSLLFLHLSLLTSPVFVNLPHCDAVGVSFPLRSGRDLRRRLTTASGAPFASHDLSDHLRRYSRFHPIHNGHRIDDAEDAIPAVRVLDEGSVEHDDASVTAPLFQGMGTHYADVWVGTPPQRKSVIVDTGSHYTAFPCVGCTKCGEEYHTDKYFDPTKSSTYKELGCGSCQRGAYCSNKQCSFSQSYTEGSSWHAIQVMDKFYVGAIDNDPSLPYSSLAFDFMFGCQKRETGLFITQLADGIMGMSADTSTLVKQLYDKKRIQHNMFSLCFGRADEYSKEGVYSGAMTIGASNDVWYTSPMVYAASTKDSGWYTVYVEAIYLREGVVNGGGSATSDKKNQKILQINIEQSSVNSGKGVIVDSGTTDTYLSSRMSRPFKEAFKNIYGKDWSSGAKVLTQDELEKMPTILFQLKAFNRDDKLLDPKSTPGLVGNVPGIDSDRSHANDVVVAMPPWHYMEYSSSSKKWTPRFYLDERSGGVLGANAMMGHEILFDWEHKRVGFAESNCDYEEMLLESHEGGAGEQDEEEVESEGVGLEENVNCVLQPPLLQHACKDSIDMNNVPQCTGDAAAATAEVFGFESLVRLISAPGTGNGMSCSDVAKLEYSEKDSAYEMKGSGNKNGYSVNCRGDARCIERRKCNISCEELVLEVENPESVIEENNPCSSSWGECLPSCTKVRIIGTRHEDGKCYEVKEENRTCHTGFCAMDTCRVPFKVHVALGLAGGNAAYWTADREEVFKSTLAGMQGVPSEIKDGDIEVTMVSDWTDEVVGWDIKEEKDEVVILGMKVTLEISIWAANYKELITSNKCDDGPTLQRFSATAHKVKNIVDLPTFTRRFVHQLLEANAIIKEGSDNDNPYSKLAMNGPSKVLESWAVKMQVGIPGPPLPIPIMEDGQNASKNKSTYIIEIVVLSLLFVMGCYVVRNWKPDRQEFERYERSMGVSSSHDDGGTIHTSSLVEKMRKRVVQANLRGPKYSKLDQDGESNTLGIASGDKEMAEKDEFEMSTLTEKRGNYEKDMDIDSP